MELETKNPFYILGEKELEQESPLVFLAICKLEKFPFNKMEGVSLRPGLHGGVWLYYAKSKEFSWCYNEQVVFDPSTEAYQIYRRRYRATTDFDQRFDQFITVQKSQNLDDSIAPQILYHQKHIRKAPNLDPGECDRLFEILAGLQEVNKSKNRGLW
ncbi:MAG: hypothetical protein AABX05_05855 [Nanoarchaeota archaeon]